MNRRALTPLAALAALLLTGCPDTKDLEACCACLAATPATDGDDDCFGVDKDDGEPITEDKCVAKGTAELLLGSTGGEGIAIADAACTADVCESECAPAIEQGVTFLAPPKSAGLVQATIDGVLFVAGFVEAFVQPSPENADASMIRIFAGEEFTATVGDGKLGLLLSEVTGPGTYPMVRRSSFEITHESDALPETAAVADPGSYVVTAVSDDHVTGTFAATMAGAAGNYEITGGEFDVDLTPQ